MPTDTEKRGALITKLMAWREHDFHADRQLSDAKALKQSWEAYFNAMPERRVMLPEPPEHPK